ncbi:lysophospholipid acyltransferase family protein [Riemerella columbina]|uniref:lysophospholipid acyltransferase family protein n=1 Tax=Riemerella columbina TaxID=103810 RepID=UPI00266EAAE2|nr:lysophospholipid acyltransferase family protein [Riemerella columbina]WKS94892.1 1-acyl-sn-glycerol-3-phosphate acyltransferase [Riemerella columbina]
MVILVYLWRLWFVVLGVLLTLLMAPWVYIFSFNKKHFRIAYFFIRIWALGLYYGMGFRYRWIKETQRKIEKGRQYVFIANHTSVMDIMLMVVLLPEHPLCFVGKKELVKLPIFGTIYKRVAVMVDRDSAKSRAEVYTRAAERMQHGQNMVIFPEGLVPDDTTVTLAPFKNGAFMLASQHQLPLCVLTFVGLKQMFPFDNAKGYPGRVKVFLNEIIEPADGYTLETMKEAAFQMIKNTIEKHEVSF